MTRNNIRKNSETLVCQQLGLDRFRRAIKAGLRHPWKDETTARFPSSRKHWLRSSSLAWLVILVFAATLSTTNAGASSPDSETESVQEVEQALQSALQQVPDVEALISETAANTSDLVVDMSPDAKALVAMESSTGSSLAIPPHGGDPVKMSRFGSFEFLIELPGSPGEAKVATDGSVVFERVHKDTDLILQAQKDTGVRMIAMLHGPDAPTRLNFGFKATGTEKAILNQDGSVAIVGDNNSVISILPASWAYDSAGNDVSSWYTIEGDTLVLNIDLDPSLEYPVIADPQFTWGTISGTAYFNRQETQDVAGTAAVVVGMLVPYLPPPFNGLVAWYVGTIGIWAAYADDDECLKIKYGFTWSWGGLTPGLSPGHYIEEAGFACE